MSDVTDTEPRTLCAATITAGLQAGRPCMNHAAPGSSFCGVHNSSYWRERREARATAPAGLARPERWVQTQWGPSEDHLHYLSHVSKWGPGLQDYGDGCRATITVENNDIDGGQFVRVIVHSIAQARATAPAGLREAIADALDTALVADLLGGPLESGEITVLSRHIAAALAAEAEARATAPAGLDRSPWRNMTPEEWDRGSAAVRATAPAGLDVERLARALHDEFWDDTFPHKEDEACCRPSAERILARLAADSEPDHD